jgi:hypothetical protein
MEKRKHALGEEHPDTLTSMAKSCSHILEAGPMEGGRGTAGGGEGEKNECIRRGAS